MASAMIDKVGIAVIRQGRILLVRNTSTDKLLLPGGRREAGETDIRTLQRELREELACDLLLSYLQFIGTFCDDAANDPGQTVAIRLYAGELYGEIRASSEVDEIVWFDPLTDNVKRLSQIVRNQILPALAERGLLSGARAS